MEIYEIFKAFLLGVVQGITEWLPISSTGHMILIDELFSLKVSQEFLSMFLVVIQLGSILAVLVLYFEKLWPFSSKKSKVEKKETYSLWFKVLVAIIPSGIAGVLLDDIFDQYLMGYLTVSIALVVYGILFIIIEKTRKSKKITSKVNSLESITYKDALLVGLFQILALVPGTSRSGSTIIGAMLVGLSRTVAAEFSFFMAVPTMLGASGIKVLKFLSQGVSITTPEIIVLIIGVVTAFLVSIVAIKFLVGYVRRHDFQAFGWYRIVLGIIVILYFSLVRL